MGLFDSVYANCPRCDRRIEFQSKTDEDPYMNRYTVEDAPTHILIDVLNDPHYCCGCKSWFALIDPAFPPDGPPRPKPVATPVRDPVGDEASLYAHDQSFGWWHAPFTFADISPTP